MTQNGIGAKGQERGAEIHSIWREMTKLPVCQAWARGGRKDLPWTKDASEQASTMHSVGTGGPGEGEQHSATCFLPTVTRCLLGATRLAAVTVRPGGFWLIPTRQRQLAEGTCAMAQRMKMLLGVLTPVSEPPTEELQAPGRGLA